MYSGGSIIVDTWTLCSPSIESIAILKTMIKEYIIAKYYITKNIYHLTFVVESSSSTKETNDFKIEEYKWSWESESNWPEQCTTRQVGDSRHIQSPIYIDNSLFSDDLSVNL